MTIPEKSKEGSLVWGILLKKREAVRGSFVYASRLTDSEDFFKENSGFYCNLGDYFWKDGDLWRVLILIFISDGFFR